MFVAAFAAVVHYSTKVKISSETDLFKVDGHLKEYSFQIRTRGMHFYYIWLDEYSATFQIPANFIDYFDQQGFEFDNKNSRNQLLHMTIPKDLATKLNDPNKDIFLISINSDHQSFLDKKQTMSFGRMNYDLWAASILFGLGIIWLFYKTLPLATVSKPTLAKR